MKKGKYKYKPFEYIAFWQFLSFIILICLVWVKEVLDLPYIIYSSEVVKPDWIGACILTSGIIVVGFIMIGHTYLQQKKVLKGLLVVCSYCRQIQLDDSAWQRLDFYVQDKTMAEFTHGVCPACYEKVVNGDYDKTGPDQVSG